MGLITVGGIVALPLLLTPAEFSLYGYVATVILVGAALGDLGLGANIIRKNATAEDLSRSLGIQLAFWLTVSVLLLLLAETLNPFGFSSLTSALLVLALALFALQALPTAVLERDLRFTRISAIEVVQRVILISIAIAIAAIEPSEGSIPLAAAVAAGVGYPAVLIAAKWRWKPKLRGEEPLFRGFSSEWWQVRMANQAAYAAYPLLGGLLYTASEVGLIVWALAITSIPAYLAPMAARATFPTLSRAEPEDQVEIFSSVLRALLIIGMPLVAGLLVAAGPLTESIFGPEWVDGVPLLRLESITTALGISLTSIVPFLFLVCSPVAVKRVSVGATTAIVVLSLALTPWLSYLAISVATLITAIAQTVVFNHMIRKQLDYSLLRDIAPAFAGLAVGAGIGLPLALAHDSLAAACAAGVAAAAIQVGVVILLGGGGIRELFRLLASAR